MGLTEKVPTLASQPKCRDGTPVGSPRGTENLLQALQWDLRRKSRLSHLPPHPPIDLREHPSVEVLEVRTALGIDSHHPRKRRIAQMTNRLI